MPLYGQTGGAVADELTRILARQFAEQLQRQQMEMQSQRMTEDTRQFNEQMGLEREQAAALETERAADREFRTGQERRQRTQDAVASDQRNVKRMLGQVLMKPDFKPEDRRSVAALQVEAGDNLDPRLLAEPEPEPLTVKTVRGPKGQPTIRGLTRGELASGQFEEYQEPKTGSGIATPDQQWVIRDGQVTPIPKGTARPGDRPYDAVAERQGEDPNSDEYVLPKIEKVIAGVDALVPPDGSPSRINWTTAGPVGRVAGALGGTEATNVGSEIETIQANIQFLELMWMRANSKTGGALGPVSDFEGRRLSNAWGSLRQDQSPGNLIKQAKIVRESAEALKQVYGGGSRLDGGGGGTAPIRKPIPGIPGAEAESTDGGKTWRRVK